jgi:hypothetical protein
LSIFLLSIKYGTRNIKLFDTACLAAALVAVAFYLLVDNPVWSVVLVSIIDFVAFLPTYRKGFQEPNTETLSAYAIAAFGNGFSIFALQNYSVTTVLYLASLVASNSIFVAILLVRRKAVNRRKNAIRYG